MSKFVTAKQFFKGFSKAFEGPQHGGKVATIGAVKPNIPINKAEKLKRDLKLARQKRIASESKLDNTVFRIEQQKERLLGKQYKKGKELEKKAKGGRVGLKFGSRKSNVQKIQETFGPKKKVPNKFKGFSKLPEKVQQKIDAKLAGNPNKIDAADLKKLRNR